MGVEQISRQMPYPDEVAGSLERLRARGWLQELKGGWEPTEQGRNARSSIETATDRGMARFFDVLFPAEQDLLPELLAALCAKV